MLQTNRNRATIQPKDGGTMNAEAKYDGSRMVELRESVGFSQQKFADFLGMSKRTLQNYEYGVRKAPSYLCGLIEYKLINEGLITKG